MTFRNVVVPPVTCRHDEIRHCDVWHVCICHVGICHGHVVPKNRPQIYLPLSKVAFSTIVASELTKFDLESGLPDGLFSNKKSKKSQFG
jgi:hypothetical protein